MPNSLAQYLLEKVHTPEERARIFQTVEHQVASRSEHLKRLEFHRLSAHDLSLTFEEIDRVALESRLSRLLSARGHRLSFRISRRMTSTGGSTITRRASDGSLSLHEIAVSAGLLHQTFAQERTAVVCGIQCNGMRSALLRIMEHEMIHLAEMAVWQDSSCSADRFKSMASRIFGHRQSNHNLITNVQLAARKHGLRPGDRVSFTFEGQSLNGFINRISRRATVLVSNPCGLQYSDGKRYLKYYVPLDSLRADRLEPTKKPQSH